MLEDRKIAIIEGYCALIRSAILKVKSQSCLFKDFPVGCCRDASLIAGMYLSEKGYAGIQYCHKQFEERFISHAWLEYNNHIIDLTADQLSPSFSAVTVLPIGKAGKYHRKDREELCSWTIAGIQTINLLLDYSIIKKEIEKMITDGKQR